MRIGIDLGGTKIAGIVMDDDGKTRVRKRVPTPISSGYDAVIASITRLVAELENEAGRRCRIGLGTPGQRSVLTGGMKNSNATCLNGRPLQRDIEHALQREIRLANDANCFALSEATDGAAKGHQTVFGVILGTGVGGAISVRGQIHAGRHDIAGEWGHTSLDPAGPSCYCGRRGCIETYLSGPGLFRDYQTAGGHLARDASEVARNAKRADDPQARLALSRYCERFGFALAGVINLLDPDVIVLGGGLSNIPELYHEGVEALRRGVFNDVMTTPILPHQHGDASGVRGAAMLWQRGSAIEAA